MLILGIDPGFAIVGFGLVEADRGRQRLVQCGAITTPAGEPLPARLRQIADDMDLLLAQFQPQPWQWRSCFSTTILLRASAWPGQGSSPAGGGAPGGAIV